jgi:hypothetical protein
MEYIRYLFKLITYKSLGEYDTEILLQTSKAIGLDSKYK